ncbi:GDSL esterase/lipase [Prunus yedoensis var. nudiflora]|uniref:GDSL esterase/lipase n=1 Tax=Prunus yedoensis var. nudiflora TaxID=2094558 RepID=A0A314Z9S1_PRUYE|nr:GDSL esterase/lipase [Prunus yedoensis var. nudiflora]
MASKRDSLHLSGPLHLTSIDWQNTQHQRSVAACLVQGVYVVERDRQKKREGPQALDPRWWEFFLFELVDKLVDKEDFSIFGAIYEFKPPPSLCNSPLEGIPRFVIAFRGTLWKKDSFLRDLELDVAVVRNRLHRKDRFEDAMQAVRNMVAAVGDSNVWLAGHSLGSAMAMLAGKTMASTGIFLKSFLFNPPFVSAPIGRIGDKRMKHGLRILGSVSTAGLILAMEAKQQPQQRSHSEENPFTTLSAWFPSLFVNPADDICSEYIGYFEHRKMMEDIGLGVIERLATQNSLGGLLKHAVRKLPAPEPPLHLIPSANLTVNLTSSRNLKKAKAHGIHQWWRDLKAHGIHQWLDQEAHGIHQWWRDFKEAHGIHQWWRDDLQLWSEVHKYR